MSNSYDGLTVAVTGAFGYLGSALRDHLQRTSARLLLVSRQARPPVPGAVSIVADVRTPEGWREVVPRADVVFHLAGNTSVAFASRDPAASLTSTVLPLVHLAAAARAAQRPLRVVYASTATVYGLTDRLPVDEDADTCPITVYDLHKLFAERELALASRHGILDGVALRLANVYGPSPSASTADDRGVLARIGRGAIEGSDVLVYGGGGYLRDYVYIDDVVRAFLLAGKHPGISGQVFNVASGTGTPVREAFRFIVDQAAALTGRRNTLIDVPWPAGADPIDARSFTGDVHRIARVCGWTPQVSLADGVDRLMAHLALKCEPTTR